MMTSLITPKIKTKVDWKTIFPMQATKTSTGSAQYMKKFTKFGLSNIVYCRGVFPKDCFNFVSYENMTLPLFKDGASARQAQFFEEWLKSCFEAFDKRYLKKMVLNFYNDATDISTLFESYAFTFDYNSKTVVINTESQEIDPKTKLTDMELTLRDATNQFMENSLLFLKCLPQLPDTYDISMQLFYNDAITPFSYEPKGFMPCDSSEVINPDIKYKPGTLSSPFHKIKSTMYRKDLMIANRKDSNNEDIEWITFKKPDHNQEKSNEMNMSFMEDETVKNNEVEMEDLAAVPDEDLDTTIIYECPCGLKDNSEIFKIIQCIKCKKWQHAACFGILEDMETVEHYCDVCLFKYNIENHNYKMICMSDVKKKEFCIMRCALSYCERYRTVNCAMFQELFGFSKKRASRLMVKLIEKNFFTKCTQDDENDITCIVNYQNLKTSVLPQYFDMGRSDEFDQTVISIDYAKDYDPPDIFSQEMKGNNDTVQSSVILETPDKRNANVTLESINSENLENVSQVFIPRRSNRKRKQPNYSFDDEDETYSKKKSKSVVRRLNLNKK